jgi:protein phosphatase methylesterase 1
LKDGDANIASAVLKLHVYLNPPNAAGSKKSGPMFVCHHGAGSSGASFANLARQIRKLMPNAGILAYDARGHGATTVSRVKNFNGESDDITSTKEKEANSDLSLETLSGDLTVAILGTAKLLEWEEIPEIVLVGHSLGGAVVVDEAMKYVLKNKLLGYCVLDVVEGMPLIF